MALIDSFTIVQTLIQGDGSAAVITLEVLSLLIALAVIALIFKKPLWVMNDADARREIDAEARRNYRNPEDDPEFIARMEE